MCLDIKHYMTTELEELIYQKYCEHGILAPGDMDLDRIAAMHHAIIQPTGGRSKVLFDDSGGIIFLNKQDDTSKQRADFFHELGHLVRHTGSQNSLPPLFVELQERQASVFQLYAAMPYYLVANYEDYLHSQNAVPLLANEFNLPRNLVQRRLDQIVNRIRKSQGEQKAFHSAPPFKEFRVTAHAIETYQLFAKLSWLAAQKGRKVNWGGMRK